MDVDGDVDGSLAQAFGCMGTVDREVLIRQFQCVLGDDHPVSAESCAFFLDMNNWSLQAALGSYYDYGSTNAAAGLPPPEYASRLPSMQFVQDITIGEGESVPPSTRFLKTWRLRNCGERWPDGCFMSYMEGEQLADANRAPVPALEACTEGDVSVEMTSPQLKGIYQSRWQLNTPQGIPFGESIWCIITVEESGLLGITQQLASAPLGSANSPQKGANPFASPNFSSNNSTPATTNNQLISFAQHHVNDNVDGDIMDRTDHLGYASSSTSLPALLHLRDNNGSSMHHHLTLADVDIPASPNGSTGLHAAVAAALPSQQWMQHQSTSQHHSSVQSSAPMNIGGGGSGRIDTMPDVPPCTPCTPPDHRMHYS